MSANKITILDETDKTELEQNKANADLSNVNQNNILDKIGVLQVANGGTGATTVEEIAHVLSGNLVPFSGGTMTGLLNVLAPVGDSNATTKKYVDDALSEKIGMDGIGDLHVWKKTVVTSEEVPAAAILGPIQNKKLVIYRSSRSTCYYADNLYVADDGTISTGNFVSYEIASGTDPDMFIGKYFYMTSPPTVNTVDSGYVEVPANKIIYIPTDASGANTTTSDAMNLKYLSKYQLVTGSTPKIPAGTTIACPVSTNPNAWQEGDDAKAAGYTLGDAKRIVFYSGNDRLGFKYGDAITVSDDGKTIDIKNPSYQEWYGSNINNVTVMSGKFIRFTFYNNTDYETSNPVYFMPSTSKMEYDSDANVSAVVQPVTGYAAIPAGTIIEYLGKLGDKTRIQMIKYVGTGLFGIDKPTVLNFNFAPKVFFIATENDNAGHANAAVAGCGWIATNSFSGTSARPGYIVFEGTKVSMYAQSNSMYYDANSSYNYSGYKYIAVAIG